jgi:hypothetical protein
VIKFLIKYHIVKDEKQAQIVLVIMVLILIAISAYLLVSSGAEPTIKSLPVN